jgi:NAD(P)-dependent dehydrogenase (short-subunit alcohol dehydrogenase family)
MKRLEGKTALITGGSSGIGLASAKLFLEEGARVAVTGRDPAALAHAQQTLGDEALVLASDAGSVADIDALMTHVRSHFGTLDILFLNAGVARALPFEQTSEQQFDDIMDINVKGVYFAIQKALPLLSPGSSVIVTTSIANQLGSPNFSVYGASKAALRSLVMSLALDLIGRGIRVNAISPGPIATPIFGKFGLSEEGKNATLARIQEKSPARRFGEPDEIARVALFLASDESSYIVGDEIVADGGMSLL